jgi:hypothetical protein
MSDLTEKFLTGVQKLRQFDSDKLDQLLNAYNLPTTGSMYARQARATQHLYNLIVSHEKTNPGEYVIDSDRILRDIYNHAYASTDTRDIDEIKAALRVNKQAFDGKRDVRRMYKSYLVKTFPQYFNSIEEPPHVEWMGENELKLTFVYEEKTTTIFTREFANQVLLPQIVAQGNPDKLIIKGKDSESRKYTVTAGRFDDAPADLFDMIETLLKRMMGWYSHASKYEVQITMLELRPGRVGKVAKMGIQNCALGLMFDRSEAKAVGKYSKALKTRADIYKKYPHLTPNGTDHVYAEVDELDRIARMLKLSVSIYSELGAFRNLPPWKVIGAKKQSPVRMICSREHTRLFDNDLNTPPDAITYVPFLNRDVLNDNMIISSGGCATKEENDLIRQGLVNPPLNWYTKYENMEDPATKKQKRIIRMYKTFRPSTFTGEPSHDDDRAFMGVHNNSMMLYKLFKQAFDIRKTPDEFVKVMITACESVMIARGVTEEGRSWTGLADEVDRNKHYMSAFESKYYRGFPTKLITFTGEPVTVFGCSRPLEPAFVVVKTISMTESLARAWSMIRHTGQLVLPYPVYKFLIDSGAKITCSHTIYSSFIDIKIRDFMNEHKERFPTVKEFKDAGNSLIGKLVIGGLKSEESRDYWGLTEEEQQQIIYECEINGYTYVYTAGRKCLTVTCPRVVGRAGSFHTYAYFLGYACVETMTKFLEVDQYAKILAYNVDSITVDCYGGETGILPGEWKSSTDIMKPHYMRLINNAVFRDNIDYEFNDFAIDSMDPALIDYKITDMLLIHAAAGIGKTHRFRVTGWTDATLTAPTLTLRDDHTNDEMRKVERVMTTQKRFTSQARIESRVNICDEFTMSSRGEWLSYIKKCQNDFLINLGDFVQICNAIEGDPVTEEWFLEQGFTIVSVERSLTGKARHEYKYGTFLDSLREVDIKEQIEMCVESKQFEVVDDEEMATMSRELALTKPGQICVGTNARAWELNQMAKREHLWMYFKITQKKHPKRGSLIAMPREVFVNNMGIYWDRKTMHDEIPSGCLFEPAFAVTVDSMQGKTILWKLFIDCNGMNRHGAFYTAVSRTKTSDMTVLVK